MALINCPECNKEISDKAKACPYCGYPIEESTLKTYDITLNSINPKQKLELIGFLRMLTKCDLTQGKKMTENLPQTILFSLESENAHNIASRLTNSFGCDVTIKEHNADSDTESNVVRDNISATGLICPRCGSTAITTGQRGVSLLWGFLGSNKTTNRCGKCGYMWQPK